MQQFHGEKRHAPFLADRVDPDDMLVIDGRDGAGFAHETLPSPRVHGEVRMQHLEGDGPLQARIVGPQHDAHAAGADQPQDPIAAQPPYFVGQLRGGQHAGKKRDLIARVIRETGHRRSGIRRLVGHTGKRCRGLLFCLARIGRHVGPIADVPPMDTI